MISNVVSNDDDEMATPYDDTFDQESHNSDEDDSDDDRKKTEIAKEETQMVNASKALVAFVLLMVATTISCITFFYVQNAEESYFESQFDNIANDIVELCDVRARHIFDSLGSMSTTVTSHARAMNATWPLMSMPDFEVQGMVSNKATGASLLQLIPIVQHEDRVSWEKYSVTNTEWISEGLAFQRQGNVNLYGNTYNLTESIIERENQQLSQEQQQEQDTDPNLTESMIREAEKQQQSQEQQLEQDADPNGKLKLVPYIHFVDWQTQTVHYEKELDFYTPGWLVAPVPAKPTVNNNLRHFGLGRFLEGLIQNDQPILTPVTSGRRLEINYPGRFAEEELIKPHSYLLEPVYDCFSQNRTIVAILAAYLRWDNFFYDLLHEWDRGIVMVLHGSCGDTFTYQLNGLQTEYIGEGDSHDTKYDYMERVFEFASFAKLEETEDETYCEYIAKIYPSDEWREPFFTDNPIIYAIIVCSCFLLTSLVFVMYDCMVQKRQKTVIDTATKTDAIVTSLFPSNVRARLIEELDKGNAKEGGGGSSWRAKKDSFTTNTTSTSCSSIRTSESIFGSEPIADLFPNVTIMFADMVGFTSWASKREPTQVFTLLETVYHSFDMIAKRRRVFKVETIGDCYVAVVGLPNPCENHAVVMAQFASRCMAKMAQLTNALQHSLGPDTADLAMRIGLHSGPVTAGVLRGDKGRFQLFGDTMNTTSRIETTGMKGRVHLSNDTARLLIDAGKLDWVAPRGDKVFAKGKGELKTYWLQHTEMTVRSQSVSTSSDSDGEGADFFQNP